MKTLITDPFEDDAISILEWGYGPAARGSFEQYRTIMNQRVGQAFMNTLRKFDQESYQLILGSVGDPFYDDRKLPDALDKLTRK